MSRLVFRLNCTGCKAFTEYHHEEDNTDLVRCEECGKLFDDSVDEVPERETSVGG